MPELYHLADRGEWLAAADAGEYRISTRGVTLAQQGFIHCALRDQLGGVAERYYADASDLVLLVIDIGLVPAPIQYEEPVPGGAAYPHIYGPLPAAAVTAVIPVGFSADGRFIMPAR